MPSHDQDVSFSTVSIGGRWLFSQCSRCGALVVPPARGAADSEAQRLHIAYHQQERSHHDRDPQP